MKKFLLFLVTAILALAGSLTSCKQESESTVCPPSEPNRKGLIGRGLMEDTTAPKADAAEDAVAFTDDQIAWFDPATREIAFRGIEPAADLSPYTAIRFELDGRPLFTAATIISPVSSRIVYDLVLYFEYANDGLYRYYLHDGYPVWAGDTEQGRAKAVERADGWLRFIEYLRADDRLRNTSGDDPGFLAPAPSMPCNDRGDLPLAMAPHHPDWRWKSSIERNTLYVIRSEEELRRLVTDRTYTPSEIDFGAHSLLLVCIGTNNGIHSIDYGLKGAPDSYAFSLTARLTETFECPTVLFAALTPVFSPDATVSFAFDVTFDPGANPEPDPDRLHPRCYDLGGVPLTRYVSPQFFAWRWNGMEENSLAVIESEEELKSLIDPASYTPSGIDFTKNTLLLTRICTRYGISEIYCALDRIGEAYRYKMNVRLNDAAVIEDLCVAMLAPVEHGSDIRFDIHAGEECEQPHPYCYDTGDVPLKRYVEPQLSAWQWTGIPENSLAVIESEEALRSLVAPQSYAPSGIDFTKNTLLLTRVCTLSGIGEIFCALDRGGSGYEYAMTVRLNCATVVEDVYIAMLAPVERGSDIRFVIETAL